jgi:hypothetical protein
MTLNELVGRTVMLVLMGSCLSGCVAVAALPAVAGGLAVSKAGEHGATARAAHDQPTAARVAPMPTVASPDDPSSDTFRQATYSLRRHRSANPG